VLLCSSIVHFSVLRLSVATGLVGRQDLRESKILQSTCSSPHVISLLIYIADSRELALQLQNAEDEKARLARAKYEEERLAQRRRDEQQNHPKRKDKHNKKDKDTNCTIM
jgi:hypothetical protein